MGKSCVKNGVSGMKILIAGMGAIGSMLAGYLVEKNDVFCVGRRWHINKIEEQGYLLLKILFKSTEKKVILKHLATSLSKFSNHNFDCIFICVKAYDLENILREIIANRINSECFVFFQNGLGIEDIARRILGDMNIIRALTNNGANIPEPGVVIHAGLGETFVGGVFGEKKDFYAKLVVDILMKAGLPAKFVSDITPCSYMKILINATINPLTALLRIRNKGVAEIPWIKPIVKALCNEISKIAERQGVKLEEPEKIVFEIAKKTGDNLSSMLQDILKEKKTEIDFINGAIVRLGEKIGIKTPINETIYYLIKAIENSQPHKV